MKKRNVIIVKRNKSHRIGIRIFTAIIVGMLLMCAILMQEYMLLLVCLPGLLWLFVLMLYYETWQISFLSDKIGKKVFSSPQEATHTTR